MPFAPRAPAILLAMLGIAAVSACGQSSHHAAAASEPTTSATKTAAPRARSEEVKRALQSVKGRPTEAPRTEGGDADGGKADPDVGAAQQALAAMAYPRHSITLADVLRSRAAQAAFARRTRGLLAAARWHELGPRLTDGTEATTSSIDPAADPRADAVSGRVNSIAVAPGCAARHCTVYVGSVGGLWKTTKGLSRAPLWKPLTDRLPSGNIGVVTIDPTNPKTIYVGTGQVSGFSTIAGLGIFRSRNGGRTWSALANAPFRGRGISAIAVDPKNPRVLYAGSGVGYAGTPESSPSLDYLPDAPPVGVYRSANGGRTWRRVLGLPSLRFDMGSATEVRLDPARHRTVWASVTGHGLYRSQNGGRTWKRMFSVENPASADGGVVVDFDVAPTDPNRVYVATGDDSTNRSDFYRSTNARAAHPAFHRLSSSTLGTKGYTSFGICVVLDPDPALEFGQCSYDLNVRVDPKRENVVYLQGVWQYTEQTNGLSRGRGTVRSTNGGVTFTDMAADIDGRGTHPDNRALAFASDSRIFFSGNDGGIWRSDGRYVDGRAMCPSGAPSADLANCNLVESSIPHHLYDLNPGLGTLEFMSPLAVSRSHPNIGIGGTQDNGTLVYSGSQHWLQGVGGDGGPAAVDAVHANVMYHQYYNPSYGSPEVSYAGGAIGSWNDISSSVQNSGEVVGFYAPLLAHPTVAGAMFYGGESVWRTLDSGGPQGTITSRCNEYNGDVPLKGDPICGDLVPLGKTPPAGTTRLTSTDWGDKKAGQSVSALAIAPGAAGTLYAGTGAGRVFHTAGALATDPTTTTWDEADTRALPPRAVSGLAVDIHSPTRVYVSFNGFGRFTQRTPGHVYRGDLVGGAWRWIDMSANLPDVPVMSIAVDPLNDAVYIATEHGVLVRRQGSGAWRPLGTGLPTGVAQTVGLTVTASPHRLYVTTQARGAWVLGL